MRHRYWVDKSGTFNEATRPDFRKLTATVFLLQDAACSGVSNTHLPNARNCRSGDPLGSLQEDHKFASIANKKGVNEH